MARRPAIAVIDIGKSNAKLALVDAERRATIAVRTTTNTVLGDRPYPHYDVERLWRWIIEGLSVFAETAEIGTISVTTHGACFALLAGDTLALPIIDYECPALETVRADYRDVRGAFAETLSPDLPSGLNAGRQFYWQARQFAGEFARVDAILPYPQYWVWRLTGEKASEITSLGCHTDLWNPRTGAWSGLAVSEGWDRLFPPLAKAWDTVGTLLPSVVAATGLPPACRVVAGIHDSNASLLPHLLTRPKPFSVLSTGTWMIVFAPGGDLDRLDAARDCLANVDAFGHAVPSSRFMAGREYRTIAATDVRATASDLERVVKENIMALPSFAAGTGPFGESSGHWSTDPAHLSPGERAAAGSLYAALVTETCLTLAGAEGSVIVEGPFARNPAFLAALAARVPRPIIARPDATGTTEGAALLAFGLDVTPMTASDPVPVAALPIDLGGYAREWQRQAGTMGVSIA
ncbi:MAG: FGGY-family carbohydrate kinase [Bauldia sp.]